jgi:hypothetical protein
MITLQEFFDTLASGEFSSVAISTSVLDSIKADKYPKIIASMNLGLIEIYKRFTLKTKEINLHEQAGTSLYYIRSDYLASSVARASAKAYLIDPNAEDPFDDEIIKITDAYNGDSTSDYYLDKIHINNKQFPKLGIFTTAFDTVKLTPPDDSLRTSPNNTPRIISLVYLASYPKILIPTDFDPTKITLYFPDWIQEPLLLYVAARLFMGKTSKMSEGQPPQSITFMAAYENACTKIELYGLAEMTDDPSNNFENNRWP